MKSVLPIPNSSAERLTQKRYREVAKATGAIKYHSMSGDWDKKRKQCYDVFFFN